MNLEKTILGCIIMDQSIQDLAIPRLNIKHFTREANRYVAILLKKMYAKRQPIDLVTVARGVEKDSPADLMYINELSTSAPALGTNIESYIDLLRTEYLRSWVYGFAGVDTDDPVEYITNQVSQLELMLSDSYDSYTNISDIIIEAEQPESGGLKTQIARLNALDIFKPGRLIVLGGRPSHGKTLLAMDIVRVFCEQSKRVCFFSMEMSKVELVKRLLKDTNAGRVSNYDLRIFDKSGVGVDYIISNSRIQKPDFVVIDYLGFIKMKRLESRNYEIGEITKDLKGLSKEINCPILLLVQAKRTIEDRSPKLHQMDDLADSAEIERDADVVMFIMRYELWNLTTYITDDTSTAGSAIIQVVKNRHGMIDMFRVAMNGFRFNDFNPF